MKIETIFGLKSLRIEATFENLYHLLGEDLCVLLFEILETVWIFWRFL